MIHADEDGVEHHQLVNVPLTVDACAENAMRMMKVEEMGRRTESDDEEY